MKKSKILYVHDYFQNFGGGERLIFSLIRKNDTLITSFVDKKIISNSKKKINILEINKKIKYRISKIFIPIYFYFFNNKISYQNCFISGNYSVFFDTKKIKNKIFYCHSLPKIFFDFKNFYKRNLIFKVLVLLIGFIFKPLYLFNLRKFDKIIVNSNFTKHKLIKYKFDKIKLIYPPIKNFYSNKFSKKNFFLSNSRHEVDKNIDKIILAFNKIPNFELIITSSGSQTNILKNLVSKESNKIHFLGNVSEKKYQKLLNQCIATINLGRNEDFGMSVLEGMSCGKPAFVINEGGYKETCKNNYNCFFINKNEIEKDLIYKISNISSKKLLTMRMNCIKTSKKYSQQIFNKKIKELFI